MSTGITKRMVVLLCALAGWVMPAWAEVPPGLYSVTIPVADQSSATLKAASREGLSKVLMRLSGQPDWSAYPSANSWLAQADRFVVQFSYEKAAPAGAGAPEAVVLPFLLKLEFAPAAMNQLVRQAGLPVWPVNRPPVLVWWVLQDSVTDYGSNIRRMTAEQDPAWQAAMVAAARDRGVPLQWPMNDLDDRINLEAEQIWQLDEAAIRKGSERYGSAWIVAGRFAQGSDGRWLGNWLLLGEGFPQLVEVQADTPEIAAQTLMALVASALSQRYAIVSQGVLESGVGVTVHGVRSFADHMASRRLLESLASVASVFPAVVQDDEVRYLVTLRADRQALEDELRLHQQVRLMDAPTVSIGSAMNNTAEQASVPDIELEWRAQ